MNEITLRAPTDDDWPAIRTLAELSLSELQNAPSQAEWLNNQESFSPSNGIQRHFVATKGDRVVGYGCIEHRIKTNSASEPAQGVYRLFVVVAPSARHSLGTQLLAKLRECLIDLGARRASGLWIRANAGLVAISMRWDL